MPIAECGYGQSECGLRCLAGITPNYLFNCSSVKCLAELINFRNYQSHSNTSPKATAPSSHHLIAPYLCVAICTLNMVVFIEGMVFACAIIRTFTACAIIRTSTVHTVLVADVVPMGTWITEQYTEPEN